jgi:15-cis-phytoene synthase
MIRLYDDMSFRISRMVTGTYSTSFSLAVRMLKPETRKAIYGIYGFVRVADEIVDTFQNFDQKQLLEKFESDYYDALSQGVSYNPILHSFLQVVINYQIPDELVKAFLRSMKMDLDKREYSNIKEINGYIYGSADVVGLMCLKVFVNGDGNLYETLKVPAQKLGSAFQKVNFLRDLKNDTEVLDRQYFPELAARTLDESTKCKIIEDIEHDFKIALQGIRQLPADSRMAVMLAYVYYQKLLRKIKNTNAEKLMNSRIRISNFRKMILMVQVITLSKLRFI